MRINSHAASSAADEAPWVVHGSIETWIGTGERQFSGQWAVNGTTLERAAFLRKLAAACDLAAEELDPGRVKVS